MKRPTVKPIAIWIMEAATLKTMAFNPSVVVCRKISHCKMSRLCKTYIASSLIVIADQRRGSVEGGPDAATGSQTARDLYIYSRQKDRGSHAVAKTAV